MSAGVAVPNRSAASISVVIPCYNAERYITAALRSVLAQDWVDLEVIVVDDGSSDGSADLVKREFPQVRLLRQDNKGVAAARNTGIRHSHGNWIAFLDADDVWLPGKLFAQWQALQDEPAARMAYSAWQVWPSVEGEPSAGFLSGLQQKADDAALWAGASGWIYPSLLLDCVVWTSTVLAHRSVFEEVGTFDTELPTGEDYDLWLRASRVTPIIRVPKPFALYRLHSNSITKRAPAQNHRGLVVSRALARWGYCSPDGSRAPKKGVNRGLARSWSDFASAHLKRDNAAMARHAALMSLRSDPRHLPAWKVLIKAVLRKPGCARVAGS